MDTLSFLPVSPEQQRDQLLIAMKGKKNVVDVISLFLP
jgi:hypothetical protein